MPQMTMISMMRKLQVTSIMTRMLTALVVLRLLPLEGEAREGGEVAEAVQLRVLDVAVAVQRRRRLR